MLSLPDCFIQKSQFSDPLHELKLENKLMIVIIWKAAFLGSFKIEFKRKDRCLREITEEQGWLCPGSGVFYKGG